MIIRKTTGLGLLTAGLLLSGAPAALAATTDTIRVEFTNEGEAGGFFFTPLFAAFHDGSFDTFNVGEAASASLEAVAEDGFNAQIQGDADAAGATAQTILAPDGFPGAPVIDPGETISADFELDPSSDLFFSFLTMVIPSNDVFIGNGNAEEYRVFDDAGTFIGSDVIQIFARDAYDAGTELNGTADATNNAAFTPGFEPLLGDAENGVVTALTDLDFLGNFPRVGGLGDVTGPTSGGTLLASIQLTQVPAPVPLPAGGLLLFGALGALGLSRRVLTKRRSA